MEEAKGTRDLDINKLLEVQDSSDVKGPALLLYTQNMPAAVLSNISTPLGIVNGAQGRAEGVVPDPDCMFPILLHQEAYKHPSGKFFPIDNLYVLCTLPQVHSQPQKRFSHRWVQRQCLSSVHLAR